VPEIHLQFGAIIGATVARMAVGALWYSPPLFVKPWMAMAGISDQQMKEGMGKAIGLDLLGSFIMAFVLVHAIRYAGATTALQGLAVGFLNWLGFVATILIGSVTYERKPFKYFLINGGYQLVSIMAMGAILAVWG